MLHVIFHSNEQASAAIHKSGNETAELDGQLFMH